ncbi:MAG TPA: bifunctional adenosylcobinamide kinase/adenosylcobinamide-phosphate guanylyltransferase [Mycobacteriales bacterium]|nr:bifunctional adenosylcobinamide kinase/adenosylcobinamide-phosphate guanylyltransferase [Mycobacteriales bacterium]
METLLLGTGSGDGWPNPFCECVSCTAVRESSSARAQSSALVDATVLLDAGPDVGASAARHGASLAGVRLVLLTHAHPDHVGPQLLLWRHWARRTEPLVIAGPAKALALLDDWIGPGDPVIRRPLVAGDELTQDGYVVRALAANHGDDHVGPGLLYDLTAPDRARLLYATDTGPLGEATLEATRGAAYDVVLLEETWGDVTDHPGDHLDLTTFATTLAALRSVGAVVASTRVAPVHLSHRNPPPAELARRLGAWGVDLLDDGARIVVSEGGAAGLRPASPRPRRTLVVGGARSGKSRFAEQTVAGDERVTYVATGVDSDDDPEWSARVAVHQQRRPAHWKTVETVDLVPLLAAATVADGVLLVDCLTLWLTAVMTQCGCWDETRPADEADAAVDHAVGDLALAWRRTRGRVVAVTNEVGQGVVPATSSGRRFRDAMGRLNAAVAAECDEVWLMTAGVAQRLR